jgi:hypothetical protein
MTTTNETTNGLMHPTFGLCCIDSNAMVVIEAKAVTPPATRQKPNNSSSCKGNLTIDLD